jgi:hypothetical protein
MNQEQAIKIALAALRDQKTTIGSRPVTAIYKERHMRLGKNRNGWLVSVPLNVPANFEPDTIDVEVYEPDGEVYIPGVL